MAISMTVQSTPTVAFGVQSAGAESQVLSVNGYTGHVTLDYEDVGALSDETVIPSKTSDLTNDSGFITKAVNDLTNYTKTEDLAEVATSGSYEDLSDTPTIPSKTSDLTNDSGFIGDAPSDNKEYARKNGAWSEVSGGVTSVNGQTGTVVLDAEDVGALPDSTSIPSKTSDLTNDGDGTNAFLTQHQSLSAYRTSSAQDVIDAGKESTSNKVTSLSSASTDTEYPSAKCVYDELQKKVDYVTIIVTCTTQDGVTVTGQTVYLKDSAGHTAQTASYNGQPVSFTVPKDFSYIAEVSDTLADHFNPTKANGVAHATTAVTLTYSDTSHITTFADVKSAVEAGAGQALVGIEIADTWTATDGTVYSDPWIIADVQTVQDADGEDHTAAIMCRKYASKESIQFDAPELVTATGNYEASVYYYVSDSTQSSTYRLLVAGTDYNVGDAISGTVYKNSLQDSTAYICKYGYNRYKDSAYRQYLNSDASVDNWWTAQHTGDTAPTQLNSVRGYKAGCSASLLAYAKPVKQYCHTNSVTDGSVVDTLCDQFWLPSGAQMYGNVNANEGAYFEYWKEAMGLSSPSNSANEGRIQYAVENHSSAQHARLRSANRSFSYFVWNVSASGTISNYNASISYRCVAACAIY